MSKPTKRKSIHSKPRVRRDSTRSFVDVKSRFPAKKKPANKNAGSSNNTALNSPSYFWTNNSSSQTKDTSGVSHFFHVAGRFFLFLGQGIFKAIKAFLNFLVMLASKSKAALAVFVLIALLFISGIVDLGFNWGKIYQGVHIGETDLSGKTATEAQAILEKTYSSRLSNKTVYIFADENSKNELSPYIERLINGDNTVQQVLEEASGNHKVWIINANTVGAILNESAMVEQALTQGRENGGIISRIQASIFGCTLPPMAQYDLTAIENLASSIDAAIGLPRVNYDVSVVEGMATVSIGHDGNMVNREKFISLLDEALLCTDNTQADFIANIEHADLQITEEMARETCDKINEAIKYGVQFVYEGIGWDAGPTDVGNWIQTRVIEEGKNFKLEPYIEFDIAKSTFVSHLKSNFTEEDIQVQFVKENEIIYVIPQVKGVIPQSKEALSLLDTVLFKNGEPPLSKPVINVATSEIPERLELQEAIDYGIISLVSEYTTEYTANVENRNHNIHLAADLLNKSIVSANGGRWSFHETAGDCNEEAGFKGASTIIDDEYVDEIGGGICQVATTVFNSVYEAGFPVVRRHNHSLYSAVYPAGRDSAVNWPDLDLIWENDTTSDVLLITSYTDSSVTVYLYGVSPQYTVTTVVGDWEEGEKHDEKKVTDETLDAGKSYVKTEGVDGSKITIYRTVKNNEGLVIREDSFTSVYSPKDEVIVQAPESDDVQ